MVTKQAMVKFFYSTTTYIYSAFEDTHLYGLFCC